MPTPSAARFPLAGPVLVGFLGLVGCASPPPPGAPAPVASTPPPAPRVPTLSVQTRYEPDGLVLALRLDGEPVNGEVKLVDPGQLEALVSPGEPIPPEDAARGRALTARGGEIRFADSQLADWSSTRELELVVAGRRYPYPQSPGAWAFGCEASVVGLARTEACVQPVPAQGMLPPHCDASGQASWEEQRTRLAAAQESCWRSLDEETLTQLPRIQDPTLLGSACTRASQGADQASLAVGIRLLTPCEAHLPPPLRSRWLIPERMATISAAFEVARQAPVGEQFAFYQRYRVTKDPRVEELRKLAAQQHGLQPPGPFLTTARALEALGRGDHFIRLCSFDARRARVIYRFDGGYGDNSPLDPATLPERLADREEEGRLACGLGSAPLLDRMVMIRQRPDPLRAQFEQAVRNLTKAREIEWTGQCETNERWYHLPPATEAEALTLYRR